MLLNDTRARVLDGPIARLARWGLSKTTLDDIASSDCSRATIHRLFPGGKDALFGTLVQREVAAFFDHVGLRLDATEESLEERQREGMTATLEQIWSHTALRFLVDHEPNAVVRNSATAGLHQVLEVATSFLADQLPHRSCEGRCRLGRPPDPLLRDDTTHPRPA